MKLAWNLFFKRGLKSFALAKVSEASENMALKGIIAVCQMQATDNKAENLQTCKKLISSAKKFNAQVCTLIHAQFYMHTTYITCLHSAIL